MHNSLVSAGTTSAPEGASAIMADEAIPAVSQGGISLDDALRSGILRDATLLAGKDGCSHLIQSVLPMEVPDTARWLKGGELVLTTGYVLRDAVEPWMAFIRELDEAQVAGLVVLASPYVRMIPDEAIAYAEKHAFPLMVLASPGPIVDVVKPIHEAIEASRAGSVREGLNIQRRLMQMVLDGQGLEAVAKYLARHLGHTVLIEDKQFNLLSVAQATNAAEPFVDELVANKGTPVAVMKKWEEDGTLKALRKYKQSVTIAPEKASDPHRTIHPVVVGGEVFGFFSVLKGEATTEHERMIIENGAQAVAIELLKQKGATESEQKMKRDFFRDLLMANTAAMAETIRRRATYLGYPMNASYWVVSVEFDDQKHEDVQPEDVNRLVGILNSLLSFRQAVVVNQGQGATILYPVKEGQPTPDKIQHLTKAIHQKAVQGMPGWTVSIGVGQLYGDLMSVPKSFKEAQHALKIGRSTKGNGNITFFNDLGIYRMLLQFAQSQDPNEFFCEPLQRLIEYNQQTDKELVKTIAAFLECNGNLTETSNKLFIHRNTLKYRLERIRDITQIELDDAENRLMLHLGLKMNQVINYLR